MSFVSLGRDLVWRGIKSLKPKGPSPTVAFIKPNVYLGPVYLGFLFRGISMTDILAIVKTLMLKGDALASRGTGPSGLSKSPAPRSKEVVLCEY